MRKTKFKLSALISLILCFAICLTVAVSLLFSWGKTAHADRATGNFTVIGNEKNDIWIGGNKPFNNELLESLYTALAGVDNYDDLENKVKTDPDKALTSADFRTQQGGTKNVSVWFAGKKWDVVYLTTDREGKNLVLDLWQSADNVTEASEWANHSVNSTGVDYPSNMYSTSKIRVETLNNGGYASTSNTTIPTTPYERKTDSEYARFTMTAEELEGTDQESVREYLVQPKNVAYQETENAYGNSTASYTCPNDAYGTPSGEKWSSSSYNYKGKGTAHDETKYEAWQEDYIWLPSLAETGNSDTTDKNGLWKTDASLRSTESKSINSNTYERTWLRSGSTDYANGADNLIPSGDRSSNNVSNSYLVRPALHLNLTSAAGAAGGLLPEKPTDGLTKAETYNGGDKTFTLPELDGVTYAPQGGSAGWWNAENRTITAKNAGTYSVKVTPEKTWDDETSDSVTFALTINKAKITQQFGNGKDAQRTDYVYESSFVENPIPLKLSDTSSNTFPLALIGKDEWGGAKFEYYIESHKAGEHETWVNNIKTYLENVEKGLKYDGNGSVDWKEYTDVKGSGDYGYFNVSEPKGYCVFFKVSGLENYETLYGYISVHIYDEELDIKFKNVAEITKDIEYGSVSHSQKELRDSILKKENIEIWQTSKETEGAGLKDDVTDKFLAEESKFRFYFKKDNTGDPIYPETGKYIGVGTYYVYVEYIGGGDGGQHITFKWLNSTGAEQRPSFTVTPKNITLQIEDKGHTYGQQPAEMSIKSPDSGVFVGTDGLTEIGDITYTYKKQGGGAVELSSKLAAGTYTISATAEDTNYHVTFTDGTYTVSQAELTFTLKKASGAYTDAPHDGIDVNFKTLAGGDSLTKGVDYKLQFNGSDDLPQAVGKYTVTVVLLDTTAAKNYKIQAEFTAQYNITVKYITKPTADNDNLSGEYKGAEYEVNVSYYVQGDEMSFTVSPSNKGAAFDGSKFTATNVGTYTLTIKLTDKDNTQWDTGDTNDITFTIEISKAELTFELNKTSDKYSGVGQDIDVIFTGNKGELTKDSDYTLTFETTGGKLDGGLPKNVGTYTVKLKLQGDAENNYNLKTVSQEYEITQAELTFKNGTGAFNGEEHSSVTVEFVGLQNGETLAAGDYTVSFEKIGVDLSNGYPKDLGVYTMKVELVSNDKTKNYKIQDAFTATYTVANGTVDKPTTTGGVVSGDYTGENYELTVSGFVAAQMEFEISPSDKGAAFDPASGKFTAKNAGEYTLTITPKEGYAWTEGGDGAVEFTIKINKITLTVTAEDKEVVYGAMPTYTVTYSGFVSGESAESLGYTATANSTYSFTNGIGDDFEITVNAPQTLDNYTVTTVSGTLTVTPKPITLKINDGGHSLGKQPQSEFTLTAGAGELVGSDTTAVFDGLITFYVKSNGVRQELTSELEMGEYELCADDGDYGNYTVTFTSGTYSVTRISIPAPTEDTNEYTYTGKAITYMPEGFDSLTMEIEGNGNVKTDAGTYQVKVRTADPDAIFEGYGTREIIFEFVIKPAKIVKLNDNGNVFIQEEVTGSTGNHAVMLAEKDESGKFANFDAVNGQKITIWATAPFPYVSGNMPARPEFDGRSRSAVYTDITALNTNDEEYPLTVDLRTVGKYVVYYLIEADNHEPLEGEWRVAVQPDSEVTKIIFKKAVELSYGDVPTADELFTMLKNSHSDYLEITRDGKDVAGEFLSEATGVTYGLWRKNQFGKYYDCGEYYINFVLPENSSRTVIYREGGNDSAADTNRDKLKITQRELSVKWNKLTYVISEGQPISLTELTELAALDTSNMADDGGNVTVRFELEGGGQIITAAGEYRVTAVLEGTNAKNYRFADSTTVTNTVVVTAATVPDEPSEEPPAADEPPAEEKPQTPPQTTDGKDGIPWWVWLIVGVGAALIIAAIVVAVVVIKRKKPEKEVIVRDINTDDDGFYDDADSGSGSGSDGGEDKK